MSLVLTFALWLPMQNAAANNLDTSRVHVALEQLIDGMLPQELPSVDGEREDNETEKWVPSPEWSAYSWQIGLLQFSLIVAGILLTGQAHRRFRKGTRKDFQAWPGLGQFLETGQPQPQAFEEWKRLQLLSSLQQIPQVQRVHSAANADWALLNVTEKTVAIQLLQHKAVAEIAEELSCTPSYIYNLRSSIRKKWGIDNNESLAAAIEERIDRGDVPGIE